MSKLICKTFLAVGIALAAPLATADTDADDADLVARGRYLVLITGCNDCHTTGYIQTDGTVPETEWLKGDSTGWQGPWGTTYPPNLRLRLAQMTADEWVSYARNLRARPPMPWFALDKMTEEDLRAVYAFVRQLGPPGEPAPDYLPPGATPSTPIVLFPSPPAE